MGPYETQLESYNKIIPLVFGNFGEINKACMAQLVQCAEQKGKARWRIMGARDEKEGIALVKNGFIREISVAAARAQAVLKRENLMRAIQQAESPFGWQHTYRMERDRSKRQSWNKQYYETFCSFGPGEGELGIFA